MRAALTRPTKSGYSLGVSYLQLLRRFPLMGIRSEAEYDVAMVVLQDLFGRDDLDADQERYLDALILLARAYESKEYDFDQIELAPVDALKSLMDANNMTAADLGRLIGSSSYASMILKGDRSISKQNAKKLSSRFKVDVGLFL